MVIRIKNPTLSESKKTFLSDDYSSGTTLSVESSTGLVDNDFVVVGIVGTEKAEIIDLTATPPTDTSLTVTSLNFTHPKDTPVTLTRWDKYALQYRTSSAGTWTDYGSMPALLQWDSLYTEYNDTSATSDYEFRFRFYNTNTGLYSDYSDTLTGDGWGRGTVGTMITNIRKIIGGDDTEQGVKDEELIRFLNDAQRKVYTVYDKWFFLLTEDTSTSTTASTKSYSLPSDFGRVHSILYNYVSGDTDVTYALRYTTLPEYDYKVRDNNASDDDRLIFYTIGPGDYFKVANGSGGGPETTGLDFTVRYYKKFATLDSYGDETVLPVPEMIENYAIAQVFKMREEEAKADYYDTLFREQIELLKLEQRKTTQPRVFYRWKGRNPQNRYYGEQGTYSDSDRINNF